MCTNTDTFFLLAQAIISMDQMRAFIQLGQDCLELSQHSNRTTTTTYLHWSWACSSSQVNSLRFAYCRKKRKTSGTLQQLEAPTAITSRTPSSPPLKALWLDDANSTGSSLRDGVKLLKVRYAGLTRLYVCGEGIVIFCTHMNRVTCTYRMNNFTNGWLLHKRAHTLLLATNLAM